MLPNFLPRTPKWLHSLGSLSLSYQEKRSFHNHCEFAISQRTWRHKALTSGHWQQDTPGCYSNAEEAAFSPKASLFAVGGSGSQSALKGVQQDPLPLAYNLKIQTQLYVSDSKNHGLVTRVGPQNRNRDGNGRKQTSLPPCSSPYFLPWGWEKPQRKAAPDPLLALALSTGLKPVCWAHHGSHVWSPSQQDPSGNGQRAEPAPCPPWALLRGQG